MSRTVCVQFCTQLPYFISGDVPVIIEGKQAVFTFYPLLSYHDFEFKTALSDRMVRAVLEEQLWLYPLSIVFVKTVQTTFAKTRRCSNR